jgi:hypothetical protein
VCVGEASCEYKVDVFKLGDPANGCGKDFLVAWRCASSADIRNVLRLPPEAGLGSVARLICKNMPCVGRAASRVYAMSEISTVAIRVC